MLTLGNSEAGLDDNINVIQSLYNIAGVIKMMLPKRHCQMIQPGPSLLSANAF